MKTETQEKGEKCRVRGTKEYKEKTREETRIDKGN
jgi:hypothetical protein